MRRKRLKHFFLIIAALGILLLGYFLGNRYQYAELRDLPVELLPEPVAINASLIPEDLQVQAASGRWLIILPGVTGKACDALLEHYLEVYNRLANDAQIQAKMHLALLDVSDKPVSMLWQHIEWANVYKMTLSDRQQLLTAMHFNQPGNRWCQDVQAQTALIGPDMRQYALLPLDKPQQMAQNLRALTAIQ